MPITRQRLLRDYVDAMHEGVEALFVGAGMSRPSGFMDWKQLMRDCAIELGLDVDLEHDLVAVAQYYLNRKMDAIESFAGLAIALDNSRSKSSVVREKCCDAD